MKLYIWEPRKATHHELNGIEQINSISDLPGNAYKKDFLEQQLRLVYNFFNICLPGDVFEELGKSFAGIKFSNNPEKALAQFRELVKNKVHIDNTLS